MMGIIVSSACLARILGSIYISHIYQSYGPRWSLLTVVLAMLIVSVFVILLRARLVPFYVYHSKLLAAGRLDYNYSETERLHNNNNNKEGVKTQNLV